jgi:hypothetical protein
MSIPVLWHAQEDGQGIFNCTTMLLDMFDVYDCEHLPAARQQYPQLAGSGAVVIVHGGRQPGSIDRLNRDIEPLKFVLLIVLGDEESSFPVEQIEHPRKKIWIQEPMVGRHEFCDRFLLDGYTPQTQLFKQMMPWAKTNNRRELDWFFAGQVTHERRRQCVHALQHLDWGGFFVETKGYCQGISLQEYHSWLACAKIVPCPSGPMSPDSARVCEALEMGAIPILDDLSPTRHKSGFWQLVLGKNHPLPVITQWWQLSLCIKEICAQWETKSAEVQNWWMAYKKDFTTWLHKDWFDLSGQWLLYKGQQPLGPTPISDREQT